MYVTLVQFLIRCVKGGGASLCVQRDTFNDFKIRQYFLLTLLTYKTVQVYFSRNIINYYRFPFFQNSALHLIFLHFINGSHIKHKRTLRNIFFGDMHKNDNFTYYFLFKTSDTSFKMNFDKQHSNIK